MNAICGNNASNTFGNLGTNPEKKYQSIQDKQVPKISLNVVQVLRQWLDQIEIHDPKIAQLLSNVIPGQCPFERDIVIFGRKLGHIPPLCKLNPFYEQLVGLRFRALCFLAEDCKS